MIQTKCLLPLEAKNPVKSTNITLVPNPIESKFGINGVSKGGQVTIFDAVGKKISSKKVEFEGDSQFDLTSNRSGI